MNLVVILIVYTIILLVVIKNFLPDSLFVNIDPDSVHFLYNGKKWFEYRLGDLFYLPHLVDKKYHSQRFPYSIATEYSSICSNNNNLQDIKKVIDTKLLKESDMVLHLRIGDVVDKYTTYITNKHYFKNEEWWKGLIKFIKENKIQRVIILAGAHMPECLEKSWKYLQSKRKFLEENDIKVNYRLACSPDEDILFSVKAKYFATSGGQYGKLLSELIQEYGGKVFK
jgi:hypothetical protein